MSAYCAAAEAAERLVKASDDRRHRPVPGRDDDPEPRPGQPGTPEQGLPSADPRTHTPVELEPHAGLRDPWSEDPSVTGCVRPLRSGHGATGRPFRSLKAEGPKLVVDDVGADLTVAPLDPLLDLVEIWVYELTSTDRIIERATACPQADVPGDGVGRATDELRRRRAGCPSGRTLRGSPRPLRQTSPLPPGSWVITNLSEPGGSPSSPADLAPLECGCAVFVAASGQFRWPPAFSSLAARVQIPWPLSRPSQGCELVVSCRVGWPAPTPRPWPW
jgi:hypothetical protein